MQIPTFIQTTEERRQLSNLIINCLTKEEMYYYLIDIFTSWSRQTDLDVDNLKHCANTFEPINETINYTILSPYYFTQSKNDATNELKARLTKTISGQQVMYPLL